MEEHIKLRLAQSAYRNGLPLDFYNDVNKDEMDLSHGYIGCTSWPLDYNFLNTIYFMNDKWTFPSKDKIAEGRHRGIKD